MSKIGTIEDRNKCPVHTLWVFCQATKERRNHLTEGHKLFLTNLEDMDQTKWQSVKPNTIASWLKRIMQDAGIDTNQFTVHSLRSAASTKAVEMGAPIQDVKLHANWSLTSNTFEDYYHRPVEQHQRAQKLVQRIFGDYTEKKTTSRVGVEPVVEQ